MVAVVAAASAPPRANDGKSLRADAATEGRARPDAPVGDKGGNASGGSPYTSSLDSNTMRSHVDMSLDIAP